jgi:hypothetical protein
MFTHIKELYLKGRFIMEPLKKRNEVNFGKYAYLAICSFLILGACNSEPKHPAPPKVDTAPQFQNQTSTFLVPVEVSLDEIQRKLEKKTPRRLWSINEQRDSCVPTQRIEILKQKIAIKAKISCRIVGNVSRGRISLSGTGDRFTIKLPVTARVTASDVGGILKSETATGSATVIANARLTFDRNWNPKVKVNISYAWREPPGIDFLGQRINFVKRADRELVKVISRIEQDLQNDIADIKLKPTVAGVWKEAFTVIELNLQNPPAWMRITPTAIGISSYRIDGRRLILTAGAEALIETFVRKEPPSKPELSPLPPQSVKVKDAGLAIFIPVVANYAQLEPVVLRALKKLSERGIALEGVGHVEAEFKKVTIYATKDNRLAVGIEANIEPVDQHFGSRWGRANGQIWLTGLPLHTPGSQQLQISDLEIFGSADRLASDVLIQLMTSEQVRSRIAESLTEDFSSDYDKVLAAARKALSQRRIGDFLLTAEIDEVNHDFLQVTGEGLFLPVVATGTGLIVYDPRSE